MAKNCGEKNIHILKFCFHASNPNRNCGKGWAFCISYEYKMYFSINFSLPADCHYS